MVRKLKQGFQLSCKNVDEHIRYWIDCESPSLMDVGTRNEMIF
jgi:hypothetical protein